MPRWVIYEVKEGQKAEFCRVTGPDATARKDSLMEVLAQANRAAFAEEEADVVQTGLTLTLTLTPRVETRLRGVQKRVNADSLTEVVQRALAVYDTLTEAEEEGHVVKVHPIEPTDALGNPLEPATFNVRHPPGS
jgi:hypothetical protein